MRKRTSSSSNSCKQLTQGHSSHPPWAGNSIVVPCLTCTMLLRRSLPPIVALIHFLQAMKVQLQPTVDRLSAWKEAADAWWGIRNERYSPNQAPTRSLTIALTLSSGFPCRC